MSLITLNKKFLCSQSLIENLKPGDATQHNEF